MYWFDFWPTRSVRRAGTLKSLFSYFIRDISGLLPLYEMSWNVIEMSFILLKTCIAEIVIIVFFIHFSRQCLVWSFAFICPCGRSSASEPFIHYFPLFISTTQALLLADSLNFSANCFQTLICTERHKSFLSPCGTWISKNRSMPHPNGESLVY